MHFSLRVLCSFISCKSKILQQSGQSGLLQVRMEQLEIERLNYNEEYDNFCSIIDQSLAGFRSNYNILDETELNVGVVTNLESMNDAIQALMDTLHQKDKVLNNDASDRIDSLKKESQDFENKCVTKENELRILASQEDFKSTELENLRRKEAKNEKVQDMMKSKISKDMEKWKNTLGLELVVSTHNSLIFKFSNILRDNPEKTFSCEMRGK